jgi:molecular chaperone GrpE
MTDRTARPSPETGAEPDKASVAGPGSQTAPAGAADPPASQADTAALESRETAELKDKLLRTLAEMENLRRRTEREVIDARLYGIASFAREVLGIADNMHRALQAARQELQGTAEPGVRTLLEGVELTERELLKVLEKHGVRRFDPLGEKFDPHLHQAMYEVADESLPPGSVAQVIQPGYMLGERILRPALVVVAKAPPNAPQPSAGNRFDSLS